MADNKDTSNSGKSVAVSNSAGANDSPATPEPSIGEQIGTVASMIGEGWLKSDTGLWNDANYQGTREEANRSLFTDNFDYEKIQKEATAQLNRVDQSMFPARNGFHSAIQGSLNICTENAIMQCAMGSVCSKLHIMDPLRGSVIGTGIKNRCAVITDCVPGLNFDGFGACWNILNPAVAAATLAASIAAGTFVLTPMPCLATMMPSPWLPILGEMIAIRKIPVLVDKSLCNCWGLGFITITHCGQGLDASPIRLTNADGTINWHQVASLAANVLGTVLSGGGAIVANVAKAAAAAKGAQAVAAAAKAGETARAASLAAKAANAMKVANVAGKVGKVGDIGSNVITIGDGVGYIVEGEITSGLLNIGGGTIGLGFSGIDIARTAKGAKNTQQLTNAFRNTLDPSMQKQLDKMLAQGTDADFIANVIRKNPEIYGDLSKMKKADLEKLIKSSKPYTTADDAAAAAKKANDSAKTSQKRAGQAIQPTDDALNIARKQAEASKLAAKEAQKAADELNTAVKNADDATEAYSIALQNVDNIQKNIDRMTKQAARWDPKSADYRKLQSMIESEKLKLFIANVDTQSAKKTLDETTGTLVDVRNGIKAEYGVETVEDMNTVVTGLQGTATEKAELVTGLESELSKWKQASTDDTEITRTGDALKQAEKKQKPQHDFADTAASIQPDADLDSKISTVSTGYGVANSVVKPAISDALDTKKEQKDSFNKRDGYGLTEDEMKILREQD